MWPLLMPLCLLVAVSICCVNRVLSLCYTLASLLFDRLMGCCWPLRLVRLKAFLCYVYLLECFSGSVSIEGFSGVDCSLLACCFRC
uniref:Putative secreted protein n=1 Tax=Anopheles darlingi TaxID=43151 RepID=A0A2M4DER2_ANODA